MTDPSALQGTRRKGTPLVTASKYSAVAVAAHLVLNVVLVGAVLTVALLAPEWIARWRAAHGVSPAPALHLALVADRDIDSGSVLTDANMSFSLQRGVQGTEQPRRLTEVRGLRADRAYARGTSIIVPRPTHRPILVDPMGVLVAVRVRSALLPQLRAGMTVEFVRDADAAGVIAATAKGTATAADDSVAALGSMIILSIIGNTGDSAAPSLLVRVPREHMSAGRALSRGQWTVLLTARAP